MVFGAESLTTLWNSEVPPAIPPPSQNKVKIGLSLALFGPCFGDGACIDGGTFWDPSRLQSSMSIP